MSENQRAIPQVASSTFIAPNATILGNVVIGEESSVWYGAVIRGDTELIQIGQQSNVQDLCVLHADADFPCILGDRVTVGHSAIIHGATIDDDVLVGMRAVVMNGAKIRTGSIVAVGSVVTEGTEAPANSILMGTPAKICRATEPRDFERIRHAAEHYTERTRSLQ